MNWLVVIPCWGERHCDVFERVVFPAVVLAATKHSGTVRYLIHTTAHDRDRLQSVTHGYLRTLMLLPLEHNNFYQVLGACHKQALEYALDGECVAFINADMVPSVEIFSAAERRFATGKRLVVTTGTRTLDDTSAPPPIGAKSADLLLWAWCHPHQWTIDCTWGKMHTRVPSVVYFDREGFVNMHGFHLHPFALIKDRALDFKWTIDCNLVNSYSCDEIHVVTDAHELSFAELSPRERSYGQYPEYYGIDKMIEWAKETDEMQRWFFTHPIAIIGDGSDIGDRAICNQILAAL